MPRPFEKSVLILIALALLLCTVACETSEDAISGQLSAILQPGEKSGWVYYNGTSIDQSRSWNSAFWPAAVSKLGTGHYLVAFAGLNAPGGNVQVTSVGNTNVRCKVNEWINNQQGYGEILDIRCHSPNGSAADSAFVASYVNFIGGQALSSLGAYVLMDSLAGGALNATYMWGDTVSATRVSAGHYVMNFSGQAMDQGNVQVTAYGSDATYCKIVSWQFSQATVKCYSTAGAQVDSKFSLRYHKKASIHDSFYGSGAFVWSNQAGCFVGCPVPPSSWNWDLLQSDPPDTICKSVDVVSVCRTFQLSCVPGDYIVKMPNLGDTFVGEAIPLVTAYGDNSNYCNIYSWTNSIGSTAEARVRCFNSSGTALVWSQFSFYFVTDAGVIC